MMMKLSTRIFLSVLVAVFLLAFMPSSVQPNFAAAEVNMIDGFYTFTDSKPMVAHDTLGVVDLGFVSGTQYESIRANLMKKARKAYPEANGIILHLNKQGLDRGVVIRFK